MPHFRRLGIQAENNVLVLVLLLVVAATCGYRNGVRTAATNAEAGTRTDPASSTATAANPEKDVIDIVTEAQEPFEPDSIRFYTMNDYFIGGSVTVTNAYDEKVTGHIPGYDSSLWSGHTIMIPSPGRLNDGYTVRVQSRRNVPPVSFQTTAVGDQRFRSYASIYLLITECPNAYLWPKMYVNFNEVEVYPQEREAPETCGY